MADEAELDLIRSRLSLAEIVTAHTRLKKSGASLKGLCPFHKEKTPSFTVNDERGLWYCFGCGQGGDIFTFVMKAENLDFADALERLARQAGVMLKPGRRTTPEQRSLKDRVLRINERACKIFRKILLEEPEGERFRSYLSERNISGDEIETFRIGAARDSWDSLLNQLTTEGFSAEDIEKAGLAIERESGGGHYDRFRGRLMIPLTNVVGDVIGFGARTLGDEPPKYINTPQSPVFDKGKILYGLDLAKKNIENSSIILTEGYMDVIALHRDGIRNSVASMGTALTENQVHTLRRYCANVHLAYDSDFAGDAATLRGIEMLIEQGLNVRVVNMPEGKDPDDILKEGGTGLFRSMLEKSPGYFEHSIESSVGKHGDDTPDAQREVILEAAPLIEKSPNPLLRDHQVRLLADRLGLEERSVRAVLFTARKSRRRGPAPPPEPAAASMAGSAIPEKKIFRLLLSSPENAIKILDALEADDFSHGAYRKLFKYCRKYREQRGGFEPDEFLSQSHPQAAMQILSGIAMQKDEPDDTGRVDDCIARLRNAAKKRKLGGIKKMIEKAEREGDKQLVIQLAQQASELRKSL